VINDTPGRFTPGKRRGTNCRGLWVSPRAGFYGCGKTRSYRDSIPGSSSQRRVAVLTELSRPNLFQCTQVISTAGEPESGPGQRTLHSVSLLNERFGIRTPVGTSVLLFCSLVRGDRGSHPGHWPTEMGSFPGVKWLGPSSYQPLSLTPWVRSRAVSLPVVVWYRATFTWTDSDCIIFNSCNVKFCNISTFVIFHT
jgi:hypothetical protein